MGTPQFTLRSDHATARALVGDTILCAPATPSRDTSFITNKVGLLGGCRGSHSHLQTNLHHSSQLHLTLLLTLQAALMKILLAAIQSTPAPEHTPKMP